MAKVKKEVDNYAHQMAFVYKEKLIRGKVFSFFSISMYPLVGRELEERTLDKYAYLCVLSESLSVVEGQLKDSIALISYCFLIFFHSKRLARS